MRILDTPTYTATIYLGLRRSYSNFTNTKPEVLNYLRNYCKENNLCVWITPGTCVYGSDWEEGVAIGLIDNPNNPVGPIAMNKIARDLAIVLAQKFEQMELGFVCTDYSYMVNA